MGFMELVRVWEFKNTNVTQFIIDDIQSNKYNLLFKIQYS